MSQQILFEILLVKLIGRVVDFEQRNDFDVGIFKSLRHSTLDQWNNKTRKAGRIYEHYAKI